MANGSKPIQTVEESPLQQVASKLAKGLLGEDMEFDFDMLISKVKLLNKIIVPSLVTF